MRRLLLVPIRHTAADLGSLATAHAQASARARGASGAAAVRRSIDEDWRTLTRALPFLPLDWSSVRLYQDGLPVCGREAVIVGELAARGSANHALLQKLVGLGATLTGTEDADLLVEELALQRTRLERGEAADGADLLARRDAAIAARIDATLQPGETGLIFLGTAHDLAAHVPEDIDLQPWQQAR